MTDQGPKPQKFEKYGKYEIRGELGQGAMGVVYKAYDPVLDRLVAIKTISASLGADAELRKRFHREAQAAARLNHSNIITVYDFGEEHGQIYIAMELLEGTDLKDLVADKALTTLDEQLAVMEQILDGLAFAHSKEIVHRDLKPGNLHVQPNGQVKILDFGLARLGSSEMTQAGMVMGTPNYMSPEQVLGEGVDVRSDVFAMGAVFYEMLTGYKPFEAESMHGVLFQVVHKEPQPVREYVPDLPPVLVQIVEKCLTKDKELRFQQAAELRDAVAAVRQALATGRINEISLDPETGQVFDEGEVMEDAGAPQSSWPPTPVGTTPPGLGGAGQDDSEVEGTIALAPGSAHSIPPPTPGTLSGRVRTRPPMRASIQPRAVEPTSRMPIYIGGAMGLVAVIVLAVFAIRGLVPQPVAGPADSQMTAITAALARTQVRVARLELDGKNYKAAITEAEATLDLQAGHEEATRILNEARSKLTELEGVAADAQAKYDEGDTAGAATALQKLLELDPSHPVATDLTGQLNQHFRSQADAARATMKKSREQAEQGGAASDAAFTSAAAVADRAESAVRSQKFAEATRGFLEARDGFDRARRSAVAKNEEAAVEKTRLAELQRERDAAAAAAAAAATPPPTIQARSTPMPTPAVIATPRPTVPPTLAPTPAPATLPDIPRRPLQARTTTNSSPNVKGFEGTINPDFVGEMAFDHPAQIGAGEDFSVKVYLRNAGQKKMKLKVIQIATRINRKNGSLPAPKLLKNSIGEGERSLIAEFSATMPADVKSWIVTVTVTGDKGDRTANKLVLGR